MRLFKNYDQEFKDLQDGIVSLQMKVIDRSDRDLIKLQSLEDEVKELKIQNNELIRELIEIKQILSNQTPNGLTEEEITIEDEEETSLDIQEVFFGGLRISKSYKKDFKFTELSPLTYTFNYYSNGRDYFSGFTIFDVMLLQRLENEKIWKSWSDISEIIGVGDNTTRYIAYNIKTGFFNKFFENYTTSFSKEYGLLKIDGKKTNIAVRTAKYIVECMTNSSNPIKTLLKLRKGKECSELEYTIIGVNYDNPSLLSLFKENKVEVENNPQKRKEKGL